MNKYFGVPKARLVEGMLWGVSWQEAVMASGLNLGRSGAYRVTWRACVYGEEALADHRHGHVSKMHAPVREWLEASCRAAPGTPSRVVQAALQDRFGLRVSVTHLNRLRASLGLSSRGGGGKEAVCPAREGAGLPSAGPRADAWVDGAGGLLLLAGARETAVLTVLEQAVAATPALPGSRLTRLRPATRAGLLRTLLFLNVVGLRRPWDLRGYSGDGLAVLTGRRQAYGYRIVERFLRELATAGGAHTLTEALGRWTTQVWRPERPRVAGTPPSFYIDGHRKPVYSDMLLPRGLVGRRGAVRGCRALILLHDAAGHPLFVTTQRGDVHLTLGVPVFLDRYEAHNPPLAGFIIDREGMAAEFLTQLTRAGRQVVTLLRRDQYDDLSSFTQVGAFIPWRSDRHGTPIQEVAPARYRLNRPDHPDEPLELYVALVRDLRPPRPVPPHADADADLLTPAAPPQPRLLPVVSTAPVADSARLASAYLRRWPAQENSIKDFLLPLERVHKPPSSQVSFSTQRGPHRWLRGPPEDAPATLVRLLTLRNGAGAGAEHRVTAGGRRIVCGWHQRILGSIKT